MVPSGEIGVLIYVQSGAGRWQIRKAVANTRTVYTLDRPFDTLPLATDLMLVLEEHWSYQAETTDVSNAGAAVGITIDVPVDNLHMEPYAVIGVLVAEDGTESPEEWSHIRDIYTFGKSNPDIADGYFVLTIVANAVNIDLNDGRNQEVTLVSGTQITINNPVNTAAPLVAGDWFQIRIIQDATGEWPTPVWGTDFLGVAGIDISGPAGSYTTFQFTYSPAGKWVRDYHSLTAAP
jgi:hypothetical protein